MKLNLGCGRKILPGYTNVDVNPDILQELEPEQVAKVVISDILKLPFDDDSVDEILAVHVFEHLWLVDVPVALKEWRRVLRVGALLVLEMPCLDKIVRNLMIVDSTQMTLWGLYGDPSRSMDRNVYELHKWCWNEAMLRPLLDKLGFFSIKFCEPQYHMAQRDFRAECVK